MVVILVDDPADCEFFPEMETYVPSLNVVELDRDIAEEDMQAYQEEAPSSRTRHTYFDEDVEVLGLKL